eukprot:scaffold12108_cov97-Isochrysis_galbana.AAC.6
MQLPTRENTAAECARCAASSHELASSHKSQVCCMSCELPSWRREKAGGKGRKRQQKPMCLRGSPTVAHTPS